MNRILIWQLALRYLRGKRSANAVTVLSRISMVAIAVCSGAMIVILSVFNGLESIGKDLYKTFYSDIRISVARGKFFSMSPSRMAEIHKLNGVHYVSAVIEDNVFAVNNGQQKIITLKGVDSNYYHVNDLSQYIVRGNSLLALAQQPTDTTLAVPNTAIMGEQIVNELGTDINSLNYVTLNYPNPNMTNPALDPASAIQSVMVHPQGIFSIGGDEFDNKYTLVHLALAQQLFLQPGKYSAIEISAAPGEVKQIQHSLKQMLGEGFSVETRYEQNKTINMVMRGEKWAIYFILVLVLLIASFNMVGALSMLVLEKQKDIAILRAMGAGKSAVRAIYLAEGVLWSLTGGVSGMLLGSILCMLQDHFGFVKLGAAFVVSAYPVQLQWPDFVLVICTIFAVGVLTSWYPAMRAAKPSDPSLKST